jgi:hypothetical protein
MFKFLALILSILGSDKPNQSAIIVNGQVKVCSVCGKSASFVRIINGKEEVYCLKHMTGK